MLVANRAPVAPTTMSWPDTGEVTGPGPHAVPEIVQPSHVGCSKSNTMRAPAGGTGGRAGIQTESGWIRAPLYRRGRSSHGAGTHAGAAHGSHTAPDASRHGGGHWPGRGSLNTGR